MVVDDWMVETENGNEEIDVDTGIVGDEERDEFTEGDVADDVILARFRVIITFRNDRFVFLAVRSNLA